MMRSDKKDIRGKRQSANNRGHVHIQWNLTLRILQIHKETGKEVLKRSKIEVSKTHTHQKLS